MLSKRGKKKRGLREGSLRALHLNGDFLLLFECPETSSMFELCIFAKRGVPQIGAHAHMRREITDPEKQGPEGLAIRE